MKILLLLTLALMFGCSGIPHKVPVSAPAPEHPIVEPWHSWRLSGRLSIRADQDGWLANLTWQQSGDYFHMAIRGPLGQVIAELESDASLVWLRTNDGRIYSDRDPDALLGQVLGVKLPLSGLRYWVHGLVEPNQPEVSRWNPQGLRTELRQANWVIQYLDYAEFNGRYQPTKIRMQQGEYKIKLLIDAWEKDPQQAVITHSVSGRAESFY